MLLLVRLAALPQHTLLRCGRAANATAASTSTTTKYSSYASEPADSALAGRIYLHFVFSLVGSGPQPRT